MSDGVLLDLDEHPQAASNPTLELLEDGELAPDSVKSTPEASPEQMSPASTPTSTPASTPASTPREASEANDVPALIEDVATPPGASTPEPESLASTPALSPESSPREAPAPETSLANGTHLSPSAEDQTAVESTTEEEKPVIPLDPRLKEIEETFGGKWKMVRSDPYDEYLKSLGIGFFSRKVAGRAYHEMELTVKEDQTIGVAMRSFFHSQNYIFKLDEEMENLVEKYKQGVVCSYENGKLVQNMTPLDPGCNKMQHVEREINENGEQEVVFTAGEVTCKRYYCRLEDLNKKPVTPVTEDKKSTETEKEDDQKPEESEKTTEKAVEASEDKDQPIELNAEQATEQNDQSNTESSQAPEQADQSTSSA